MNIIKNAETVDSKEIQDAQSAFVMFDKKFLKSKDMKTKVPLAMSYLKLNSAINGNVGVSIDLLVRKIGYIPNTRLGRVNSQVIKALEWLKENKCISIDEDLGTISSRPKDCFIVNTINRKENVFNPKGNFVILTEDEFNSITKADKSKVRIEKQTLLNVFLNIKKFINLDPVTPNLCYPSHATLCRDCKITSTGSINNAIKALEDIGVLYTYNSGLYTDSNGNVKYANSFYAIEKNVLQPEVCDSLIKQYYLSQGLVVDRFVKEKEKANGK